MLQSGYSSDMSGTSATSKGHIDLLDDDESNEEDGDESDDEQGDGNVANERDNNEDDGKQNGASDRTEQEPQKPADSIPKISNKYSASHSALNAGYFQPQMISFTNNYSSMLPMQQASQADQMPNAPSRFMVDMTHAAASASIGALHHHIQPQLGAFGFGNISQVAGFNNQQQAADEASHRDDDRDKTPQVQNKCQSKLKDLPSVNSQKSLRQISLTQMERKEMYPQTSR